MVVMETVVTTTTLMELLITNLGFFAFVLLLVHAQDQSGFVSIDCGIPEDSSYNDETTDIKYVSDASFVQSGTIHSIDPKFQTSSLGKQFQNVRSFPEGKRSCYDVQLPRGKGFKYLIRTRFMYGNYDNLGNAPEFDLYLGVNLWDSVTIDNATTIVTKEMIHTLPSDHVHVCLVDKDKGTPFLSVLELRLLKSDTYETPYESLMLYRRWDLGALGDRIVRYKDDVYDRIWMPLKFSNHRVFSTNLTIDPNNNNGFQPARAIMNTASSPLNASIDIILYWEPLVPLWKFYVYMHFAEVQEIPSNETREFTLIWNGNTTLYDKFSPRFLHTDTLYTNNPVTGTTHEFLLQRTAKSTLPPIINAIETYRVNEFLNSPTDQQDVDAIMRIKSKYGVKKNWLGDPCAPVNYPWKDINCIYIENESPKIISVNLSLSGLTGEIDPAFSNLTLMQKLDLSNNSLTGNLPDFLGNLHNLTELNLEGNKLTGAVPVKLLERSNNGLLSLRVGGNPELCMSASCQHTSKKTNKKSLYIIPLVASVVGALGLVIAIALFFLYKKRHRSGSYGGVRTGPLDTTKRYYKYSEVVRITNNFERVLGQGGFGKVYHGVLNDEQVAVKILSESSAQGYKEFKAEVELLLRVHHKNLTALIGYCNEGKKMALIYEFMANGTLGDYLSGKKSYVLSWEERLQITLDAAQGLEYLHNGCKPQIVQRDVKPANILINEKLQAKVADFGLSRSVALDGNNQDSTVVAGTIGYLDPEYHSTQRLSEKSDVYSFGVVLLEVVTGQPVIARSTTAGNRHITDRVELVLSTGDLRGIVDSKLGERFNAGSAWKITEIAMACASRSSKNRPTMSQVVAELKESVSRARAGGDSGATSATEPAMTKFDSAMFPQAR